MRETFGGALHSVDGMWSAMDPADFILSKTPTTKMRNEVLRSARCCYGTIVVSISATAAAI